MDVESGAGSWLHTDPITRKEIEAKLKANGSQEGDFVVRLHKGNYVLAVIFNGNPTHHEIKSDEAGILSINGNAYSKCNTLSKLVKRLSKPREDWPVVLHQAPPPKSTENKPKLDSHADPFEDNGDSFFDDDMFGDEPEPPKLQRSKKAKAPKTPTPTDDNDDPFGGDDFNFGTPPPKPKVDKKSTEKSEKLKPSEETPAPKASPKKDPTPSWLNEQITRREAEVTLSTKPQEGKFLVRKQKGNHVLSVVYNGKPTHHRIEADADGQVILNGNKYTSLKDLVASLSKPLDWWPVVLAGGDEPTVKDTKKPTKDSTPEIKSKKKKKEKQMSEEEKEKMQEDAAQATLHLQAQLANAQIQAEEEATKASLKAEEKRKKKAAKAEAERVARSNELTQAEAQKYAQEDQDFVNEATEAAKMSKKEQRIAAEMAAQEEKDRAEAAALLDAFDGPTTTKKKKKSGGANNLSGWKLKKAQRKALTDAEEKKMGYMEYITQNCPELVEHGMFETTPKTPKPPPPAATINVNSTPISTSTYDPTPTQPPTPTYVTPPAPTPTPTATTTSTTTATTTTPPPSITTTPPSQSSSSTPTSKKKDKKVKKNKTKDTPPDSASDPPVVTETPTQSLKKDKKSKKKKNKKVEDTNPTATSTTTATTDITYTWETRGVKEMDARREELIKLNFTGDEKLIAEFAKLTKARSALHSEANPTTITTTTTATAPTPDTPSATITTQPPPPSTLPSPPHVGAQAAANKKKGGWFGGIFASEPEVEEFVPDHDNDDDGLPLNRIELLRRQNKRAKNAKLKAARIAAGIPDPPPTVSPANAEVVPSGDTVIVTSGDAVVVAPQDTPTAYASGSLGIDTIVEEEEEPNSNSSADEFVNTKKKATPKEEWLCEFCDFKHTKFAIVEVHENNCSHNPNKSKNLDPHNRNKSKNSGDPFGEPSTSTSTTKKSKKSKSKKSKKSSSTSDIVVVDVPKPEVVRFDDSSDSSSDSNSDTDTDSDDSTDDGYVKPKSSKSKSKIGDKIEIDADLMKELMKSVSELSTVTTSLQVEVSSLHQDLAAVKAELSTFKAHVAGNGMDNSISNIYPWHQHACEEPQIFYQKLSDRKIELQKQAQPGIQDSEEKEAWSKEWNILNRELKTVTEQIAKGTDSPKNDVSDALNANGDANNNVEKNSFSILAIGGRVGTLDATAYLERYDLDSKTWISLAPLPTERFGIAAGYLLGYVYVVGGSGAPKITSPSTTTNAKPTAPGSLNLVERYDLSTNRWEQVAKCSATRAGLGAAILNENLYVIGGASDALFGSVILNSGEKYNPRDNTWRNICPMSTKRAGLALAVVDGHLYAIGGYDQNVKCLTTVERYDPQTNRWATMASMSSPRARLALAVVGFKIYALGGYDGSARLKTVECYDVSNNIWANIASMRYPRDYHAATAVGGQVHVVGGFNGSERLCTIEAYDSEQNAWVDVPRMKFARDGLCAVGVDLLATVEDEGVVAKSDTAA